MHPKLKVKPIPGKYYFITVNELDEIDIVEEISNYLYRELKKANDILFEMNYQFRRATEVFFNLEDYKRVLDLHLIKLASPGTHADYGELALIDVNRVINNIFSSFKVFVDHFEIYYRKSFGETSTKYIEAKAILNSAYVNNFEYRFAYGLRNFSQHNQKYILGKLSFEKTHNKSNYKLTPYVDKLLLINDNTLSKYLKIDLKDYNLFFPIDPIINKFRKVFDEVADNLLNLEITERKSEINLFYSYIKKYPNKYKVGFAESVLINKVINFEIELIPQNLIIQTANGNCD
ncbi:hypothetical protein [Portibacter marinus]|uniref:hypothetical protein n=1 Tax=Portibacter marinus TaxID=2898660 RepID=UPI001F362140|nr:hypothetical protein [Portibacter marinus]